MREANMETGSRDFLTFVESLDIPETKKSGMIQEWNQTLSEQDKATLINLYDYLKGSYSHMGDPELIQIVEEFVSIGKYPVKARKVAASIGSSIDTELVSPDRSLTKTVILPVSTEELEKIISDLGGEVRIDYADAPFYIDENSDVRELNQALNTLNEVDPDALPVLGAMISSGLTMDTAVDIIINNQFQMVRNVEDEKDLGYNLISSDYYSDSTVYNNFIDYEAAGKHAVDTEDWVIDEDSKIAFKIKK